ncbi:MAG: acylphosphatase [Actinomycetota bacterium]
MSDTLIRCRVIVRGRVQGVFYRDSCRQMAQRLGVNGWVRNLPDGTIEFAAEGRRSDVEMLLTWAREGPPRAAVSGLDVHDESVRGETTFRVAP